MNARIYYDRGMHALTSSLAMVAQRMPFLKTLCPFLSSPATLAVATPVTVTFVGTHSLSGQSVMIVPVEGFVNPVEAQLDEEFQWVFTTDRFNMRDVTTEGLPEGLSVIVGTGGDFGFSQIVGTPAEPGEYDVTIVAWRFAANTGFATSSVPYSLTIKVPGPSDPFTTWREFHWKGAELDDPAISGPNGDPDGDGIENLLEFVLDLDPKTRSQMPGEFIEDPEDDSLFKYEIPLSSDADEVNVVFQQSSTLKPEEWTDVSEADYQRTDTSIILSVPKAPGRKLYRLRVTF